MVVGGDFNCRPGDFEMKMLGTLLPELHDSWALLHPDEPGCTSNSGDQGKGKREGSGMYERLAWCHNREPECKEHYVSG